MTRCLCRVTSEPISYLQWDTTGATICNNRGDIPVTETILVPIEEFHPWTRAVGETVHRIESPDDTFVVLMYPFHEDEVEFLGAQVTVREQATGSEETVEAESKSTEGSTERLSETSNPDSMHGEPPLNPDIIAQNKSREAGISSIFEAAGFAFEVVGEVHDGDPAATILTTCEERDIDRIYLFGRKRSPVGKATFGSMAQGVLFGARIPVTVVPQAAVGN